MFSRTREFYNLSKLRDTYLRYSIRSQISDSGVQRQAMFRSKNKGVLPSSSQSASQTGKRRTVDWQLNPDPVDGQMRQGTKKERLAQDAHYRPILLPADLCPLIKGQSS